MPSFDPPPDPPPRSALARALFALLRIAAPPLILLALLELALAALGLGETDTHQDLSRGFDASVAYLVPDPTTGGHRTQMFDDPSREVALPPKTDTPRVLLMGGSNTQQLWAPLIELAFRGAGAELEVLNLGREGYGSSRVVILLEQALVSRPDLVLLYTGHNEFIEPVFRDELAAVEGTTGSALARAARSLRSYRLLVDALRPPTRLWSEPSGDASLPPPLEGVELGISPSEVDERHVAYRANLERMIALSEAAGARVVLCTLVGNMLAPPYSDTHESLLDDETRARRDALRKQAAELIPDRLAGVLDPPVRVRVKHWYGNSGVPPDEPAPQLRTLLGELADTRATRGGKTESIDGAHWPDPSGWAPRVVTLIRGIERFTQRTLQAGEREMLERALPLLDEALSLDPRSPSVYFMRGVVLWLLARDVEAVEAFDRARDLDSNAGSASRIINGIVREVAAAHPGVALLDADALFRARVPSGLIGYEVMMDRCHLQPGARWVLELDMARFIAEALGLPEPATR
ncbi:MAG: hypothetical protein DHS20C15_13190 [Planctomycetota bacterium]|nr:MAG: hypothetical protein DHS20C15_13190 [Planctomycetota bacterium]